MAGHGGRPVDALKFLEHVDVCECLKVRVKSPDLIDRDVPGVEGLDHGAEGERCMAFEIHKQGLSPVDCMKGLKHSLVPPGYRGIAGTQGLKQVTDNCRINAGHIARRDKNRFAVSGKGSCMQPAYGTKSLPDIVGAGGNTCDFPEPGTLDRVTGHDF